MDILREEVVRFHETYPALPGSGAMHAITGGWGAILAGLDLYVYTSESALWSTTDLRRLDAAYREDGIRGCVEIFGATRSYSAINAALTRYHVRTVAKRELQEA